MADGNLRGEAEEALGQINETSRMGVTSEKGEPKIFRAAQHWIYDLQVLDKLNRDKDPPLEPVRPNLISMAHYDMGDVSKGRVGRRFSIPKERSYVMKDESVRMYARYGV